MKNTERRIVQHVRNKAAKGEEATVWTIRGSVGYRYDKLLDVINESPYLEIEPEPERASPYSRPPQGDRRVWLKETT